jgi:hypothetical protein
MGSAKIKKRGAASAPVSRMPRQAAIPCLVLVAGAFILIAVVMFFALRSAG